VIEANDDLTHDHHKVKVLVYSCLLD